MCIGDWGKCRDEKPSLIYRMNRRFYQQSEPETLLRLYISLVRPHLEYASPVWSPYTIKDITLPENIQKFGCKLCTKQWDSGYEQLLELLDLPKLSTRRLYLDLSTMYKIIHGLLYFPPDVFSTRTSRTPSTIRPFLYHCPFARTNYLQHSYVPRTINAWNTLPLSVVDTTFSSFKYRIWDYI